MALADLITECERITNSNALRRNSKSLCVTKSCITKNEKLVGTFNCTSKSLFDIKSTTTNSYNNSNENICVESAIKIAKLPKYLLYKMSKEKLHNSLSSVDQVNSKIKALNLNFVEAEKRVLSREKLLPLQPLKSSANHSRELLARKLNRSPRRFTDSECWVLPSTSSSSSMSSSPISPNKKIAIFNMPSKYSEDKRLISSNSGCNEKHNHNSENHRYSQTAKFSPLVRSTLMQRRAQRLSESLTKVPTSLMILQNAAPVHTYIPLRQQPLPRIRPPSTAASSSTTATAPPASTSTFLNRSQSVICRQSQGSMAGNQLIGDIRNR